MSRRAQALILWSAIALMVIFTLGCSKEEGVTVAKIGDRRVTIDEIDRIFQRVGARFPSAEEELKARRNLVDTLIDMNLLVIGAYEHNLDNHEEVLRAVEGEKGAFLRDALIQELIVSKSIPSEAEIKDWYGRMGEEFKVSHIVVDSLATAEEILAKLKAGGVFEELALQYSRDPYVKRNQGDLGWLTWGTMFDNFQEAVYRMQSGEVSAPVKTEAGYHIIKLVDRRKLERRDSYAEMKEYINKLIMDRRQRQLFQEYVAKLKKEYPITVEKPTCQFVLNKLEFLYPETISGRPRWRNNFDPEQLDLAEKDLVLGKYTGGQITIGDYLGNLPRVPPEMRPDFDKYDSLGEIIFQMELMDIMTLEAQKMGIEDSKKYKDTLRRFKELAMADVMRNDTIPYSVQVDEGEVQEYYDTHPEEFTTPLRFHVLEIQLSDEAKAKTYARTLRTEDEFARTASKETLRPGKQQVSGNLGIITREQYPELFDLAANLKQGRIAGPAAIGNKYSLIWVKERLQPMPEDFGMARRRIIDTLTKQKGDAAYAEWLKEMKKRIPVELYERILVGSVDSSKYIATDSTAQGG